MKTHTESGAERKPGEISSVAVLGARLTWVMLGPAALLLITWGIVARGSGWLTVLDAAFAVVVGLMMLGRWVEQRSGVATTLTGQPATLAQCKHYIAILLLIAAVAWVVANIAGNHVLH